MYGLIGKKVKMSQIFNDQGHVVPVTLVEAGPCVVSQIKTIDSDGYNSIQLAFGKKSKRNTNKPTIGHLKKADIESAKVLAEFESLDTFEYKLGQKFDSSIFHVGEIVDVRARVLPELLRDIILLHRMLLTVINILRELQVRLDKHLGLQECLRE
jgi:large subunit ribosomal protein L3